MGEAVIPPLPPGFKLDAPAQAVPPLPPGFTLDSQPSPTATEPSMADKIAGHPIARFLAGAASPIIAAGQLGANVGDKIVEATGGKPVVGKYINEKLAEYEASKNRGMGGGMDWMGLLGSLAPSTGIANAATNALPAATSLLGKMGVGAAAGGAVAAAQPVTHGDSYFPEKAAQTGMGAIIGGAAPAVTAGISKVAGMLNKVVEPLHEKGRDAILQRYRGDLMGNNPDVKAKIIETLENQTQGPLAFVEGSQPTAGELLARTPEATGLAAHQKTLAKSAGNSTLFAARSAEQEAARKAALGSIAKTPADMEAALTARAEQTTPMRENALGMANLGNQRIPALQGQVQDRGKAVADAVQQWGQIKALENAAHPSSLKVSPVADMASKQSMRLPAEPKPTERLKTSVETALERVAPPRPEVPVAPLRTQAETVRRTLAERDQSAVPRRKADRFFEARDAANEVQGIAAQRKAEHGLVSGALENIQGAGFKELKAGDIASRIQGLGSVPGIRSSDVASKSLGELEGKIKSLANEHGNIDARDVYTIRKEAGNVIQKYADENKNFDQRMTAGLVKDVQGYLDDAIEGAGGKGWKDYLKQYGNLSKPINEMHVGQELQKALQTSQGTAERGTVFANAMRDAPQTLKRATGQSRYQELGDVLRPEQTEKVKAVAEELSRKDAYRLNSMKTNLTGGNALSEEGVAHIPNLLSRPAMIANFVMKKFGEDANTKINAKAAEQYLNPSMLAEALRDVPPTVQQQMVDAIMKRAGVPLAAGTARQY